jgi:hypothetical protein
MCPDSVLTSDDETALIQAEFSEKSSKNKESYPSIFIVELWPSELTETAATTRVATTFRTDLRPVKLLCTCAQEHNHEAILRVEPTILGLEMPNETRGHNMHSKLFASAPVLTCTEVQCAILCRMLERCLKMLQNSIACFQKLCLSFV